MAVRWWHAVCAALVSHWLNAFRVRVERERGGVSSELRDRYTSCRERERHRNFGVIISVT